MSSIFMFHRTHNALYLFVSWDLFPCFVVELKFLYLLVHQFLFFFKDSSFSCCDLSMNHPNKISVFVFTYLLLSDLNFVRVQKKRKKKYKENNDIIMYRSRQRPWSSPMRQTARLCRRSRRKTKKRKKKREIRRRNVREWGNEGLPGDPSFFSDVVAKWHNVISLIYFLRICIALCINFQRPSFFAFYALSSLSLDLMESLWDPIGHTIYIFFSFFCFLSFFVIARFLSFLLLLLLLFLLLFSFTFSFFFLSFFFSRFLLVFFIHALFCFWPTPFLRSLK